MYGEELFYEGITGYMHPHAAPVDPYEKDRKEKIAKPTQRITPLKPDGNIFWGDRVGVWSK